jgi:glycosyltransferase involved in cell wall biosynthesis
MNILYLTNHLNIGGITSYVLALTKGFRQKGYKVYIASSGGELLLRFVEEKATYVHIPIRTKSEISPKIIISFSKLAGFIKKNSIDIVHSHSRTTQVLGALLANWAGIVHVSTCHGFFKKRLSRRLFPCWGDRVIAISEAVKEHLVKDFCVSEEKISVIRHGIDVHEYRVASTEHRAEIKRKIGLGEGPVVGIVARLSEEKGHVYLIEAIKKTAEQIPNVQLLIVGEGRMKEKILNLTKGLGLEKRIFFLSSVLNTQEVLSAMDVFVLPSLKEGLGLSLIEAMACGLAVIGSDIGGIKSLIEHRYNGLLVKPADSQGLADAILELLSNPQEMKALGSKGEFFISENFREEKMILETEDVYRKCLNLKK